MNLLRVCERECVSLGVYTSLTGLEARGLYGPLCLEEGNIQAWLSRWKALTAHSNQTVNRFHQANTYSRIHAPRAPSLSYRLLLPVMPFPDCTPCSQLLFFQPFCHWYSLELLADRWETEVRIHTVKGAKEMRGRTHKKGNMGSGCRWCLILMFWLLCIHHSLQSCQLSLSSYLVSAFLSFIPL